MMFNPCDPVQQALAVLDECGGNYKAALELAKAAINSHERSDMEFDFRRNVYGLLLGKGGYEC